MKINNCNLKELRNYYANSDKFIIRIREQNEEKKNCQDIVYCEGIKAFYVENKECTENTVTITIPENVYKINQTNLRNIINNPKDVKDENKLNFTKELDSYFNYLKNHNIDYDDNLREELDLYLNKIENKINSFVNKKVKVKEKLNPYFEISIKGGDFYFGTSFLKETKVSKVEEIKNQVPIRLRLLNERLKKFETGFDLENTLDQLKNIKSKDNKISFELKNPEKLSLFELTKIEALMILYTTFTLKFEKSKAKLKKDSHSGLAEPKFRYNTISKTIDYENKKIFNNFNKNIEKAISNYEKSTKIELEKKYQHSFMIKKKLKNYPNLLSVIPFEEEYYTFEKENDSPKDSSNDKRGRIDCIFVDSKENQSDIYLIELKVNEGVIGKANNLDEHGINTHLDDIDKLLHNKGKLNLNVFLKNIVKRYNYRNKILGNSSNISDSENCNLHYWIICAINGKNYNDEKKHAIEVLKKIQELKKDNVIKELKAVNFLEESSNEYYLKTNDGKKCDIKLLFNIWKMKEDKENNKFLTIEEFREYYKI